MSRQRTLNSEITAQGVGLHTGQQVRLRLIPAEANTGIVFRRTDTPEPLEFKSDPDIVTDTRLSTTLTVGDYRVGTIEHLMSALAGLGVDNVLIELDGSEVPIMDGSAAPFVFLIQSAGIRSLAAPKQHLRIKRPVEVGDGDRMARIEPFDGFRLDFTVRFNHPVFPADGQHISIDFSSMSYVNSICRARTFGFLADAEKLRKIGLARGGSLSNAIVLDNDHVMNEDGLRTPDEFVRHKILDAIGDLYVCGHPLLGHYAGHKAGHELNNQLIRKVLADDRNWELVSYGVDQSAPVHYLQSNFASPMYV